MSFYLALLGLEAFVRDKSGSSIEDLKIGKMMEDFGFRPEASHSTARALILNLVRSAYGAEAAREFMRQMNLEKNRGLEASVVLDQFKKDMALAAEAKRASDARKEIPGVGSAETQMSLFDLGNDPSASLKTSHPGDDIPGTFHQKKSRRA